MIFESDTSGIDKIMARINKAQAELPRIARDTAQRAGDTVAKQLSSAAPKGKFNGLPPVGDGPGKLSNSFLAQAEQWGTGARMELKTTQGQKLEFVVKGRGVVLPKVKKALMWPGLPHPVRRAGPSKANDFVSPILTKRDDVVKTEMQKAIQEIKDILNA